MSEEKTTTTPADAQQPPVKTASAEVREKAQQIARQEKNILARAAEVAMSNSSWGKNLTPQQRAALQEIASHFGLTIGLHIIMLGGNAYITFAGVMVIATRDPKYTGLCRDEPLDKKEWAKWGIPETAICAWLTGTQPSGIAHPYIEVGWAGPSRDGNQPVAKAFPGELARKRARARVLSLAFPTGLPVAEEIQRGYEIPEEILQGAMKHVKPEGEQLVAMHWLDKEIKRIGASKAEVLQLGKELFENITRLENLTNDQVAEIIKTIEGMEGKSNEPESVSVASAVGAGTAAEQDDIPWQ